MKINRIFNTYLTTAVSISLVLFLIGIEVIFFLTTHSIANQVKENVSISLVINSNTDNASLQQVEQFLTAAPYCREYKYISKEDALQDHIKQLGEDPAKYLGFNPLNASYELFLTAAYANTDSLQYIETQLADLDCVDSILYDDVLVDMLDNNIHKFAWVLIALSLILLFIAIVLIINTVRLQVYAKRFLIRTMQLVGATPYVIKRPIVVRNIIIGLCAAALALCLLAALYYVQNIYYLHILLSWQDILIVVGTVIVSAILLTALASMFATNRYIKMKTDDLYYV